MRFRKHFRVAPPDTWNDDMVPLSEFLDLDDDDREGKFPYIWSVDRKQPAQPPPGGQADGRVLRGPARLLDHAARWPARARRVSRADIENQVRQEVAGQIATGLMKMAGGSGEGLVALTAGAAAEMRPARRMAPWIDTPQCTSPATSAPFPGSSIRRQEGFIKDPDGGPYKDIVNEKCSE